MSIQTFLFGQIFSSELVLVMMGWESRGAAVATKYSNFLFPFSLCWQGWPGLARVIGPLGVHFSFSGSLPLLSPLLPAITTDHEEWHTDNFGGSKYLFFLIKLHFNLHLLTCFSCFLPLIIDICTSSYNIQHLSISDGVHHVAGHEGLLRWTFFYFLLWNIFNLQNHCITSCTILWHCNICYFLKFVHW